MLKGLDQQSIIDEFNYFDDWLDRYQYLIDLGKQLPEFSEKWRIESNQIQGCQSQVWLQAEFDGQQLVFYATSDAAIVRGLIALLLMVYSHKTPADILATKPDFITEIGLDQHLSPTRSNGLHSMLAAIKRYAEQYS